MLNKLPSGARRVFRGKIFDVYHWKQRQYDGSTKIFERLWRPDTAQVIAVTENNKIIIQEQSQPDRPRPFVSLPGGRLERDESPLSGAQRELLEETGHIANDWELLKKETPHSKIIWTVHTYIARRCAKKQQLRLDAGEKITLRYISFDDFLLLSENERFSDPLLKNILFLARLNPNFRQRLTNKLFP